MDTELAEDPCAKALDAFSRVFINEAVVPPLNVALEILGSSITNNIRNFCDAEQMCRPDKRAQILTTMLVDKTNDLVKQIGIHDTWTKRIANFVTTLRSVSSQEPNLLPAQFLTQLTAIEANHYKEIRFELIVTGCHMVINE